MDLAMSDQLFSGFRDTISSDLGSAYSNTVSQINQERDYNLSRLYEQYMGDIEALNEEAMKSFTESGRYLSELETLFNEAGGSLIAQKIPEFQSYADDLQSFSDKI